MQVILILAGLIYFYPSRYLKYREITQEAFEKKKNDKTPKPIFAGEVEPEIPGWFENNSTLEGIDKNNNGIRDDIDVYINRIGKNNDDIRALRQLARAEQNLMLAMRTKDPFVNRDAWKIWGDAMSCYYYTTDKYHIDLDNYKKTKGDKHHLSMDLRFLITDTTSERDHSFYIFQHTGGPMYLTLNLKTNDDGRCDFELENVELLKNIWREYELINHEISKERIPSNKK